MIMINNTL